MPIVVTDALFNFGPWQQNIVQNIEHSQWICRTQEGENRWKYFFFSNITVWMLSHPRNRQVALRTNIEIPQHV